MRSVDSNQLRAIDTDRCVRSKRNGATHALIVKCSVPNRHAIHTYTAVAAIVSVIARTLTTPASANSTVLYQVQPRRRDTGSATASSPSLLPVIPVSYTHLTL